MASGRSARLVGRDAELGRLRELAAEAAAGTARVALVRGEPGIGKTRLVSELLDELRADGALVLTGQGMELADGAMAYGVASALVRGAVRQEGVERVRELAGAHADALGVLHPALGGDTGGASRQALFGALDVLVAGLASDRLVCLAVDDFQWADASSRELLRFLASSLADLPLLLVATVRTTPADVADASQDVAALARTPGALVLGLSALPPEAVAAQLAEVVGPDPDPELVERVQRLSEGVPLYVEELAAGDGHRLSLSARLSGLSFPTAALLRSAAVAEGRADLALVARVAGLEPDRADSAFRDAVDRGLLESSRDGVVRFHHGLLREQVLDGIEPLALRGLHAAWADVVPEMAGGLLSPSETVTARALHLTAADDVRAALPAAIAAAVVARRDGAWSESVGWWERAIALWDACPDAHAVSGVVRAELIGDLVVARQYVPRPDGFAPDRSRIQEALARLTRDDWIDRVLLQGVLDMMERYAGNAVPWRLEEPRDAVLARVADQLPAPVAVRTLIVLLSAHGDASTAGDWQRVLEAAREMAADGDGYQLAAALNNYGFALLRAGDEAGVLATVDEFARRPELAPYLPARLPSLTYFLVALGRPEEAMKVVESQLDADTLGPGGITLWGYALPNYATSAYLAGAWHRCAQVSRLILDSGPDPLMAAMTASLAVMLQVRRGEPLAPEDVAAVERDDLADLAALGVTGLGRAALAVDAAARGDLAGAWERLEPLLAAPDFPHDPEGSVEPLLRSAQLLLGPGRDERRADTVRRALGEFATGGRYVAAVRREVETILDAPDDPARWAQVVAAWDLVSPGWDAAHARLRWAAALVAAGDRTGAADPVREGLAIAERLGAVPLADDLRSLSRSGRLAVVTPTEPAERPAGLTEREADVLALVGRGLTNAQIGERLYMSPKTASVHVSRLIAKLGAANRTEAAAHAQRLGLVGD